MENLNSDKILILEDDNHNQIVQINKIFFLEENNILIGMLLRNMT